MDRWATALTGDYWNIIGLVTGGLPFNLSLHCRECKYMPKFYECVVLYQHKNEETCQRIEACHANNSGTVRVSEQSINWHKDKIKFLKTVIFH